MGGLKITTIPTNLAEKFTSEFIIGSREPSDFGTVLTGLGLVPFVIVPTVEPALRYLPRVYRLAGDGDHNYNWQILEQPGRMALVVVQFNINQPVKTDFRLLFRLPLHLTFLVTVARAGRLGLNFGGPSKELIVLETGTTELADCLRFFAGSQRASRLDGAKGKAGDN